MLPDAQLFAWIEHLEHCPSCRARLSGRFPADTMYQEALDHASAHALAATSQIVDEWNAAPGHLIELLQLSASDRGAAVVKESRFKTYSLASYILGRSASAVSHDPRHSLFLARLAHSITVEIDPRTCGGTEALTDLRAYALAREGNAQRVCGDMAAALAAFGRTRKLQIHGGVDPDLLGQIDLLESSLRRDLRQTQEAMVLLDRAAETFLLLEDHTNWLHSQISRANALMVQEEFDSAGALLEEILPKTDDPKLVFFIRHNLASALALAGRASEASKLHEETQALNQVVSAPLIANRRRWLEGIIARELGETQRADSLLKEVSTDLDERGYALDAALARLDRGKLRTCRGAEPIC